jgi:hypothetical protein
MGRLAFLILALILTSIAVVWAQTAPETRTPPTAWRLWRIRRRGRRTEAGVMGDGIPEIAPSTTPRAIAMVDPYGYQAVGEIGLLYGRTAMGPWGRCDFGRTGGRHGHGRAKASQPTHRPVC